MHAIAMHASFKCRMYYLCGTSITCGLCYELWGHGLSAGTCCAILSVSFALRNTELGKQAFSECCGINQLYLCYIRDQWMRQDEEILQLLCSIVLRSASLFSPLLCSRGSAVSLVNLRVDGDTRQTARIIS